MSAVSTFASPLTAIASAVGDFLVWWGRSLAGLVPAAVRRLPDRWREHYYLDCDREKVTLVRTRGRASRALLDSTLDHQRLFEAIKSKGLGLRPGGAVTVRLASDQAYARTVTLPLAAARNLRQIIVHEIERQTPFKADQVAFDCRVIAQDKVQRQIAVEFVIAKRALIEQLEAVATQLRLKVDGIGLAADREGSVPPIDLLQGRQRRTRGIPLYLNAILIVASIALGALWVSRSYDQLSAEAGMLNAEVGKVTAAARRAEVLQKRISQVREQGGFLTQRRQETSTLDVLREVTNLLPDEVWVFEFQLTGKESRIAGYAPEASALIAAFEPSRLLQNPRFRAPVTRAGAENLDRFDLSFDLRAERLP